MRRLSKRRQAERANRLLQVAARLATQQGWPATTVEAIAAEVGVAKGTVYLHYASKDQLTQTLVGQAVDGLEALLQLHSDEGAPDPVGLLGTAFACLVDAWDGQNALGALTAGALCCELVQGRAASEPAGRLVHAIARLVAAGQARGALRTDIDARNAAVAFLALAAMPVWLQQCARGGSRVLRQELWMLWLQGMKEPRPDPASPQGAGLSPGSAVN
jgi:AcrR family transcriptional regulator